MAEAKPPPAVPPGPPPPVVPGDNTPSASAALASSWAKALPSSEQVVRPKFSHEGPQVVPSGVLMGNALQANIVPPAKMQAAPAWEPGKWVPPGGVVPPKYPSAAVGM